MNEPMKSDGFFWLVHAISVLVLVKTQKMEVMQSCVVSYKMHDHKNDVIENTSFLCNYIYYLANLVS